MQKIKVLLYQYFLLKYYFSLFFFLMCDYLLRMVDSAQFFPITLKYILSFLLFQMKSLHSAWQHLICLDLVNNFFSGLGGGWKLNGELFWRLPVGTSCWDQWQSYCKTCSYVDANFYSYLKKKAHCRNFYYCPFCFSRNRLGFYFPVFLLRKKNFHQYIFPRHIMLWANVDRVDELASLLLEAAYMANKNGFFFLT